MGPSLQPPRASDEHAGPRRPWVPELDNLRALAVVAVVVLHVTWETARHAVPAPEQPAWLAASQWLLWGAPVFAFLTAFLLFYHYGGGASWRRLWARRLLYVGAPYLLWLAVYLVQDLLAYRPADPGRHVVLSLLFGVRHLFFIHALFQFWLVFPLYLWLWRRAGSAAVLAGSFLLGALWLGFAPRFLPADLPPTVYSAHGGLLPAWLPYFALGAWAAENRERLTGLVPEPRWIYALSLVLLTWTAVVVYGRFLAAQPAPERVYAGSARLAVLGAMLLWLPFLLRLAGAVQETPFASLCREVARYSYAMLLIHPLPLRLMTRLVPAEWGPWAAFFLYGSGTLAGMTLLIAAFSRAGRIGLVLAGLGERVRAPSGRPRRRVAASRRTT